MGKYFKKRKCERCGKVFRPHIWNHVLCGSKTERKGCSWINVTTIRSKRRWQNINYRNYQSDYGKKWKKLQRALDTDYAKRQKERKRIYYLSKKGKEESKQWRKKNIEKVLFWNKKRILAQKKVTGSHSWQQWQELKAKYKNRCVRCGMSEDQLKKKWCGTNFSRLTEDHIVPTSKGGTDYIKNIQPLCISCNARKKDT